MLDVENYDGEEDHQTIQDAEQILSLDDIARPAAQELDRAVDAPNEDHECREDHRSNQCIRSLDLCFVEAAVGHGLNGFRLAEAELLDGLLQRVPEDKFNEKNRKKDHDEHLKAYASDHLDMDCGVSQ